MLPPMSWLQGQRAPLHPPPSGRAVTKAHPVSRVGDSYKRLLFFLFWGHFEACGISVP